MKFSLCSRLGCLCLVLNLAACGGSGGGGGSDDVDPVVLAAVEALFPINGADWNDYVTGADFSTATDTDCNGAVMQLCAHGGELRTVAVGGRSSCAGLSAEDDLGAFDWICDDSTNPVRMVSTGLADGAYLSDLIDFATPAFKANRVSVFENGALAGTTPGSVWWNNALEVDNDGGTLATASTLYLVTADTNAEYTIGASRVAVVVQPGVTVTAPAAPGRGIQAFGGSVQLWIEGTVDAAVAQYGIFLSDSHFTRVRNVSVSGGDTGIYFAGGRGIRARYLSANDASNYGIRLAGQSTVNVEDNVDLVDASVLGNGVCGVFLSSTFDNRLTRVVAINNGSNLDTESGGICLSNARVNYFSDIVAADHGNYGIHLTFSGSLGSVANRFDRVRVSNNNTGIVLRILSQQNVFTRITATNNSSGLSVSGNLNLFAGVTVSNSFTTGIGTADGPNVFNSVAVGNNAFGLATSAANLTVSDFAASNNTNSGIALTNSTDNYFTGELRLGNNGVDCDVTGGTDPGLDDTTCANNGASDAALTQNVSLASSFAGKVGSDDTRNVSDTAGTAAFAAGLDPAFDWIRFDNDQRAWGLDGSAFPNADQRGEWPEIAVPGPGRIWDWSLSAADAGNAGNPALLGVLPLPDGDDTVTADWINTAGSRTFLRHAIELTDGIGNDDGFCESGETCLYTPNIGSYQGHGELVSAGPFVDGALTGITLLRHAQNGR